MEYLALASSFATPLVILWFGFRFNKRLESMKTETGWKKTWADDCLGIVKKVRLGPY